MAGNPRTAAPGAAKRTGVTPSGHCRRPPIDEGMISGSGRDLLVRGGASAKPGGACGEVEAKRRMKIGLVRLKFDHRPL